MYVFLHEMILTLSRFEARVGFVDNIESAAPADNLAIGVSVLESFDGGNNFHSESICASFHLSSTKNSIKQWIEDRTPIGIANFKKKVYLNCMSEEDTQPAKSRNPEKYTLLDKEAFPSIPPTTVRFCHENTLA